MSHKRQEPKQDRSTAARDNASAAEAEKKIRQGYEKARDPEPQGDGDPAPLEATENTDA